MILLPGLNVPLLVCVSVTSHFTFLNLTFLFLNKQMIISTPPGGHESETVLCR